MQPTIPVTEDPELVLIEGLAQEVVQLYDLKQLIFETNYHWQYHHDYPEASECILKFVSFQATRDNADISFNKALHKIVTKEEEAKGQAIHFKVRKRAKEIIDSQKPKKKKKEKVVYIPPTISESSIRKMKMYADLLDEEPRLPGDDEPDFCPSDESAWSSPLTVAGMYSLADALRERDRQMQETEKEFLSEEPTTHTVEFDFATRSFGTSTRPEPRLRIRGIN